MLRLNGIGIKMFASTARNHCFRTLLEEYFLCSNERGTLWQSHFSICYRVCTQCGVSRDTIGTHRYWCRIVWHYRTWSGYSPVLHVHVVPVDNFEFKILRSASESPSLRILGMIRCSTGSSCSDECLSVPLNSWEIVPIYSIDLLVNDVFVDSFKLAKAPRKHMAALPYWNSLHSVAFCRKWL
jgi:hypothetical protein